MKRAELQKYIDEAMASALSACTAEKDNPVIAWHSFITRLDCDVSQKIGDDLERSRRNRYTGEPMTEKQMAEFKKSRRKLFAESGIILEG